MIRERWGQLWGWLRDRARGHARWLEAEHGVAGLRTLNSAYVKRGLQDSARIEQLEARMRQMERERNAMLFGDVPGLTPAEIERLAILAEECGEVVRAVGKVFRFGWESQSPYKLQGGRSNRAELEQEIGHVRAAVNLMLDAEDLRLGDVQAWQKSKRGRLNRWTQHQACSIPREEQLAMMAAIANEQR